MSRRAKKRTRDEQKLMLEAIEQSSEAIALADPAHRFVYVNPAFSELFGYSAAELRGKDLSLLAPRAAGGTPLAATPQPALGAAGFHGAQLLRARAKGGKEMSLVLNATPLKAADGETIGFATAMTNLAAVAPPEPGLVPVPSVFENAYDGIVVTDADGTILDVNPAFTRITGYERDEVLGRNPRILQSGRQSRGFYAALWERLLRTGYFRGEVWNRRKDGSVYAQLLTILAVRDESGLTRRYLGIFDDITNLKTRARELERQAHQDPLTGLPNRLLLADRLAQAIAQARRTGKTFAVCLIDLDGFKAINDTYGHHAGDEVLIATSKRLEECIRDGDTIARLGGDEFVLLLANLAGRGDCEHTLQRVIANVSDPVTLGGRELSVSMSIGIALFPADGDDPDILLERADQSMYAAKRSGRNRFRFFSETRPRVATGT